MDDLLFALNLDGKPAEEWSGYEKRRMRKLAKRISHLRERAGAPNVLTHEVKHALPKAGSRLVAKGIVSYFEWLAEHHPNVYAGLLGLALQHILRHEGGDGAIEVVDPSIEEIEMTFRENNLPPLEEVFQLPPRIDLNNP